MTEVKVDPKLNTPITKALEPHAADLLAAPLGTRVVAVVELAVVEHAEKTTSDEDDITHIAKVRPVLLEVATGDDAHHIRDAMRALYTKRTGRDTLTGADDADQADTTLRLTPHLIGGAE